MPKTKKAFERKYEDYSGRRLKYQFDIFVSSISEAVEYYMPEEFKGFLAELHDLRDKPDFYEDRIAGLPGTEHSIPEENRARAMEFSKKWTNKILAKLDTENHPLTQFLKNEIAVASPVYGDSLRAELSNPSLKTLRVGFGCGYKIFGEGNDGKPKIVANESAANLGDELRGLLNKHYDNVKNLYDLEFKRQKDIDNNLAKYNEKQYLSEYKKALQNLVQDHDAIVEFHKKNKDKEYTNALNNELSELTEVNSRYLREHLTSVKSGLKAQISAIDHGWGADELGIIGTLGQIKGEIELQERFLREKKEDYAEMQDGPQKEEAKAVIEATERKINTFKEEFNPLYEECINADVTNNRLLKTEITKKIADFANSHRKHICMFDTSGMKADVYSIDISADSVLDPYGMKGLSKADQLKDFMDDLNAVDGTFQKSSANFKELRKRLEELNELARRNPGEMTEDEQQEYLTKVEEVKSAAKKYIEGKKEEERLYSESHNGEALPRKEITKRRISFATELDERLDLLITHSFEKQAVLSDEKENLLKEIKDGPLTERQVKDFVFNYFMTEYEQSFHSEKNKMMPKALSPVIAGLNLSGMDGKELREFLLMGTKSGTIRELFADAEAAVDKIVLANQKCKAEKELVKDYKELFGLLDKNTEKLNQPGRVVSNESKQAIYDGFAKMAAYWENYDNGKVGKISEYLQAKKETVEAIRATAHPDLITLANALEHRPYLNKVNAIVNSQFDESPELKNILNQIKEYDQKKADAEENYLKKGVYPAKELFGELQELQRKLNVYFQDHQKFELAETLRNAISDDLETLYNAIDYTAEKDVRVNEYNKRMKIQEDLKAEEKAEKAFLQSDDVINLKTETIMKPEDTANDTLMKMENQETEKRQKEIAKFLNAEKNEKAEPKNPEVIDINAIEEKEIDDKEIAKEEKEIAFNKIVASACRSLYMEMLAERYEFTDKMSTAQKKENEKNFRKALVFGFKDKNNMKEFADLMKSEGFGKYFKNGLKMIIEKDGKLDHEAVLKARDYAIVKEYQDAMPEIKLDEKGKIIDDGKEADFIKADNVRELSKLLGSDALGDINKIRFPLPPKHPGYKDYNIVTDYSKKPVAEHKPAGPKL